MVQFFNRFFRIVLASQPPDRAHITYRDPNRNFFLSDVPHATFATHADPPPTVHLPRAVHAPQRVHPPPQTDSSRTVHPPTLAHAAPHTHTRTHTRLYGYTFSHRFTRCQVCQPRLPRLPMFDVLCLQRQRRPPPPPRLPSPVSADIRVLDVCLSQTRCHPRPGIMSNLLTCAWGH